MISLNYRDSRPIYEQLRDELRRLVVAGALSPDEKLPSVRELASSLAINPNTIQRAYRELEGEGYIYTVPGKGSFVSPNSLIEAGRVEELRAQFTKTAAELLFLGVPLEALNQILENISQEKEGQKA